ncbi:MAG: cytochrome o ubiquinol oxidase subunit IV [Candidatus Levybacteria bacterium]|nr:cytochrome o ubiquinol oxidase subunit IV [Candidatus Levybacteria bacterium]
MKKTVGSVRSYVLGFIFSIVLTLISFAITIKHIDSDHSFIGHEIIIGIVLALAVLQLFVQLIFFLHLGHEKGPRWNLVFLASTITIFIMVVVGSMWIMYHLNYNMMPEKVGSYIMEKEGIRK